MEAIPAGKAAMLDFLKTGSKHVRIALVLAIVASTARGQTINTQPPMNFRFELSVTQVFDDGGNALLAVNTSLPFSKLVFLRDQDRFESVYRVYLYLEDKKGNHVRGDVWEERVSAETYKQSKSSAVVSRTRRSFPVEPGDYKVKVELEVLNTSLRYKNEKSIRIVGAGGGRLELAVPSFSKRTTETGERPPRGEILFSACTGENRESFTKDPAGDFSDFRSWLRASFALVSGDQQGGTGEYVISARVTDAASGVVLYGRWKLDVSAAGHQQFCLDLNVDDLLMGYYTLHVGVDLPGTGKRTESEGGFSILFNRGMLGRYFSETIEMLSIFADKDELAGLIEADPQRRMEAWLGFWEERARSDSGLTSMQEFFVRLRYIQRHFARHGPGWETDMGKVYLRYGHPERIDERSGGQMGRTFQLWFYYSYNLLFIFDDMRGGQFYLVETRML